MKKVLLGLFFIPAYCIAQIPAYYNSVDFDLTGDALKNQLGTLITSTHNANLEYTPGVWDALKQTDLDPDNTENVLLIYGYDDTDNDPDNDRTRDKDDSCHTSSCVGLWVREHVYPRSLGTPNLGYEGPGSDPHHLRAVDYYMNNSRSNKRFADGSGNSTSLSGGFFYPGDEWKGDVARMMMYMYVRYQSRCLPNAVGSGSSSYSTFGDMPDIFLEWNEEDPVSQYEINRNNILQNIQGNRNPFIDNPYLATIIWNGPEAEDSWGVLATTYPNSSVAKLFAYPTVTTGVVTIANAESSPYQYSVYNSMGQKINAKVNDNVIDISNNAGGIYFITATVDNERKTFKIILN